MNVSLGWNRERKFVFKTTILTEFSHKQGHSNRVIVRRTISGERLASLSASRQTNRFPTMSAPIDPDSINKVCFSIEFVVFQEEEWNLLHIHTVTKIETRYNTKGCYGQELILSLHPLL